MWTFSCPTIVYGDDALAYLYQISEKKALIVSDKAVIHSGLITRVADRLDAARIQWRIFDQIGEVPAVESVDKGGRMACEYQPDWIIALGSQDCVSVAKAIVGWKAPCRDEFMEQPAVDAGPSGRKARLMVIPALLGADGDVPQVSGEAFDNANLELNGCAPAVAILDPELFQQLSPQDIALVGMETLCKAIEGYVSPWGSSITDGPALMAVRQVLENIVSACEDAEGSEARMQLQHAAFLADLSASHVLTGLAHGAARALASIYQVPRRLAAGMLLPYAMEYLIHSSLQTTSKYAEIARYCCLAGETSLEAASALVDRVRDCAAQIGHPLSIRQCILDKAQFEAALPDLIDRTLSQAAVLNCVRVPDKARLAEIFRCAYEGVAL